MIAKDIIPCEVLRRYIRQYRLRHFIFPNNTRSSVKPFPPRPEQTFTFYARGYEMVKYADTTIEYKKPRSVISGQFSKRVDRLVSFPEILMVIVDFKPVALQQFIDLPLGELADSDIDAELVIPEVKWVNDRISSESSYQQIIHFIEQFFLQLYRKRKNTSSNFLQLFYELNYPDYSVDNLANRACVSLRQLERRFDETIGISPKAFLRIARFHESYQLHLRNTSLSWFDIAMACGYTDYQHLVRDYKQFASNTPVQFFYEERLAPGRVLGLNTAI